MCWPAPPVINSFLKSHRWKVEDSLLKHNLLLTCHNLSADIEVNVKETAITSCCAALHVYPCMPVGLFLLAWCWLYAALAAAIVKVREGEAPGISGPDQTCKLFVNTQETDRCVHGWVILERLKTNQLFFPLVLLCFPHTQSLFLLHLNMTCLKFVWFLFRFVLSKRISLDVWWGKNPFW